MTIYSGTWDCSAFFELAEGKSMAMPGEDVSAVLRLVKPMVLEEGQQITIRNSGETIGSGKVSFSKGQSDLNIILTSETRFYKLPTAAKGF